MAFAFLGTHLQSKDSDGIAELFGGRSEPCLHAGRSQRDAQLGAGFKRDAPSFPVSVSAKTVNPAKTQKNFLFIMWLA